MTGAHKFLRVEIFGVLPSSALVSSIVYIIFIIIINIIITSVTAVPSEN